MLAWWRSGKMSQVACDLSHLLVKKYYGSIVAKVCKFLCINGPQILGQIIVGTKLKPSLVRKALCVLVQHKLVVFHIKKKRILYNLDLRNVLYLLQIPKIIYTTKLLYGDPGELIVEEMLVNGMAPTETTIEAVVKRLPESSKNVDYGAVKKVFEDLIAARFLVEEKEIQKEEDKEKKDEDSDEILKDRKRARRISSDDEAPDPKRSKLSNLYYSINFDRYSQYFRDQIIVSGMARKFGTVSGEIVRTLLRISEVTTPSSANVTQPISSNEIKHALPLNFNIPLGHVEQYLGIMANDEGRFVERSEESSSCMYVVNLKKCIDTICHENVLSYIQERFGAKCCRIVKLLMVKKHMEQKQVEDFAMIPSKEAKELLYQMWAENMLIMQEIPRTADHAPSRTYYLFNINLQKTVRTILTRTYRTILNVLARQEHEIKSCKRLTEKHEKMESVRASAEAAGEVDEGHLEDIEGMLTPAERDRLQQFEHCCNKLRKTQIQVANTAFLFNLYLQQ